MSSQFPGSIGYPVSCLIFCARLVPVLVTAIDDLPDGTKRVHVHHAGGDIDYRVSVTGRCDYLAPRHRPTD